MREHVTKESLPFYKVDKGVTKEEVVEIVNEAIENSKVEDPDDEIEA